MPSPATTSTRLAGLASLGAGAIHVAVIRDHAAVWWASGAFFALLAAFQLVWAGVALARPALVTATSLGGRAVWWSGLGVNAGSAVLWVLTRLVGEPFGPNAGSPLPVGPAGIISTALEALLVVALVAATRLPEGRRMLAAVPFLAVATVVLGGASGYGVAAALEHDHSAHRGTHEEADHHGDDAETDHGHDDGTPDRQQKRDKDRPGSDAPDNHDDGHADDGHGH